MKSLRKLLGATLRRTGYDLLKPGDLERILAERGLAARNRQDFVALHPLVKGKPIVELASVRAIESPERRVAARRLLDAYKLASSQEADAPLSPANGDLWTNLVKNELGELLSIIAADDASQLARFLCQFGEKYTWFGGLTFALDGYTGSRADIQVALVYLDKLICLAEAIGVLPIEHPEHGRWGENIYEHADLVVSKIEKELGIPLAVPAGAVFTSGLKTEHGVLHYRHLNAIYTAHLVTSLAQTDAAIAEYGGGLGTVALYARRMGIRSYTLFDLPITNLFAGHFLISAIGSDAVSLFGKEPRSDTIQILPYWTCTDVAADSFELSLNQDSFPEVDAKLVDRFLKEILRTTQAIFLSINHEAQSDMTETERQLNISAILKNAPGYSRLSRKKYWLREGYAEEVYRLTKY